MARRALSGWSSISGPLALVPSTTLASPFELRLAGRRPVVMIFGARSRAHDGGLVDLRQ